MTIEEIRKTLHNPEYSFLKENPNLNTHIALIGLGGSHAYGTETPDSDLDIRGIATNTARDILARQDFEHVVNVDTDTTIYSLDKMIFLLCENNPNTMEILGLKPEHYLYTNKIGKILLENKSLFISKRCIQSFGGYADDQLRRMENKAASKAVQEKQIENILKSIQNAMYDFKTRHYPFPEDAIKLYMDKSIKDPNEQEIFMDVSLKHYPLTDHYGIYSEINQVIKDYKKGNNHRNKNAICHDKLGKHMMHLVRLYLTCFDILEKGEVITHRANDLPLLNSIRRGDFLDDNTQPKPEFYDLLEDLRKRFDYAKENTNLPEKVDMKKVKDLLAELNGMVIKGET
jgi:predicted nucleotidyltransferase